ncbi:MAG: hypothetical protein CMM60_00585 [Rhodospirillaceae bacterium]|nr:hypothetical protein [Rhodospirillaceae bacterium]|tara:strand:+ start:3494 stop:3706 length:213 start_codon:yes stop_codon:yes gene_type:complete
MAVSHGARILAVSYHRLPEFGNILNPLSLLAFARATGYPVHLILDMKQFSGVFTPIGPARYIPGLVRAGV